MKRRYSNIICPYCNQKLTRWLKLKEHTEEAHVGLNVPDWILNELK